MAITQRAMLALRSSLIARRFSLCVDACEAQAFYTAEVTVWPLRFNCSRADTRHSAPFAAAVSALPGSPA